MNVLLTRLSAPIAVTIILITTSINANYLEQEKIYHLKEVDILKQAISCKYENLIFIKMFDGYVALPNTYYLVNMAGASELKIFLRDRHFRGGYNGQLVVGRYSEKTLDGLKKFDNDLFSGKEVVEDYKGFKIHIRRYPDPSLYQMLIYKNGEFIRIEDSNIDIWWSLIDAYEGLKVCNRK